MQRTAMSAEAREQLFRAVFQSRPAILAPMEDVTDAVFRRICRSLGAGPCVTEFVNVEGLLRGCRTARRKITLEADDDPTAIQIYGSDAPRLAEAAEVAAAAEPAWLDINCGCWVPKVAGRGAGAGWLREPDAMVAMAEMVVRAVAPMPVTVKTRIGWGPESHMPILELAKRLEGVGVRALTIHCRTANMGHSGAADWDWARRAKDGVSIPVIVNGDVVSGETAERALASTGCAGVMIGRRAIEHPWVFREVRARLDEGRDVPMPTPFERLALCREHLRLNAAERGEEHGVRCTRRHLSGYLHGLPGAASLRQQLNVTHTLAGCLAILDEAEARLRAGRATTDAPLRSRAELLAISLGTTGEPIASTLTAP
jgi:tRNA-dihydrouridine synthase B